MSTPFNKSEPAIFWRAKDTQTGEERKFVSRKIGLMPFEDMAKWVRQQFRSLELLEVRPYDPFEDRDRRFWPIPLKHVLFDAPKQIIVPPDPSRRSVLIQRKRILKGA